MAITRNEYVATAGQTQFDLTFPYISRLHVKVRVNGVDRPFTWVNATRIALATPAAAGDTVRLQRETPVDTPRVTFSPSAVLTDDELNESQEQLLFRLQESEDRLEGLSPETAQVALDAARAAQQAADQAAAVVADKVGRSEIGVTGGVASYDDPRFNSLGGGGDTAGVTSINGRSGSVTLARGDVGLGNVDNTSDTNKPVSTAQQAAINTRLAASANLSDLTSPSAARTNLGASALGNSLFTSTSSAAAQAALGLRIGVDIPAFNDPRFGANATVVTPAVSEGASAAANTAAIVAALADAADSNGPVRVVMPTGAFNVNPFTISGNNVSFEGQGQFNEGTQLLFANATGDCITVTGQYNVLSGLYLTPSVRRTSGFYIRTTGAFETLIERVRWDFGWNGLWVGPNTTEARVRDCSARYMLGENPGILFRGDAGQGCYRLTIENFRVDNPYPIANYSTYKARTNGTAFSVGQMTLVNNGLWMCVTAGTTGSSAPSGVPGSTHVDWIDTHVQDGSVQWRYVANGSSCWVDQDSYAYSLIIDKSALINGAFGYRMRDSANTGSSYPIWAFCWDVETDHPAVAGVALTGGEGFFANGSWFGSTLNGNGVLIDATYRGEVFIGGGTRIYGNAQHGILLQAGPNEVVVNGCFIGANSTSSLGTFHGIAVANGASGFTVSSNHSGPNAQNVTGYQGFGVAVGNGCSNFNVFGNDLTGNLSGALSLGTSPSNHNVFANIGSAVSTITAAAPNEILSGTGSPEGVVSAAPGTLYRQTDGANGYTLWYKRTAGTGSAGWSTVAGSHTTAVLQPQQGIIIPTGFGISYSVDGSARNGFSRQADGGYLIGANGYTTYVAFSGPTLIPEFSGGGSIGSPDRRVSRVFSVLSDDVSSDARLKTNVQPLKGDHLVDCVGAVSYERTDHPDGRRHYGWLAQDVKQAAEALGLFGIANEGSDGYLSLTHDALLAVLWNTVRDLRAEVRTLKAQLS